MLIFLGQAPLEVLCHQLWVSSCVESAAEEGQLEVLYGTVPVWAT